VIRIEIPVIYDRIVPSRLLMSIMFWSEAVSLTAISGVEVAKVGSVRYKHRFDRGRCFRRQCQLFSVT
jgi:hypothetical protein